MEILRWSRHITDLNIVFRTRLKKAFKAGRRVFGPLAFVAMGEEHYQTAQTPPFGFAAGNELVNNDLCPVDEVAELRLPDTEHLWVVEGVTVIEAEYRCLRKQRVMHAELRLALF